MITFFEIWVSFKYLLPKTKEKFFSIITIFSFVGISLGVATLIIVMSVMNGFRDELTNKILGVNGHLKLQVANQIFLLGTVKAKLIQPCSLTLEPVVTTIYKRIARTFFVGTNENKPMKKSVFELTEKSFDNDIILDELNLGDVLMETISLETPDYPKKSGASIRLTRTESIDRENPFSILSKLKK